MAAITKSTDDGMVSLKGKTIQSTAQMMLRNCVQFFRRENANGGPFVSVKSVYERTALALGMSRNTVSKYASSNEEPATPHKKRKKSRPVTDVDEFTKDCIRRLVYEQYSSNANITLNSLLCLVKCNDVGFDGGRTSLRTVLKEVGFVWKKHDSRKVLIERDDIAVARRRYLRRIRENLATQNPHPIIYLDETWIFTHPQPRKGWQDNSGKAHLKAISGDGARFIVLHAGNENGWIEGASLLFRSKTRKGDYHNSMNAENFQRWVVNQLIPNIPSSCIIVMDNAPYHSQQIDRAPTAAWKKQDIASWLDQHNIAYPPDALKRELLVLVKENKIETKHYIIDEILKDHGHSVLRLPPYHCDLNPIELCWAQAKQYYEKNIGRCNAHNATNVQLVWQEALDQVTSERWADCVRHVRDVENNYWQKDSFIEENVIEPVIFSINETDTDLNNTDDETDQSSEESDSS